MTNVFPPTVLMLSHYLVINADKTGKCTAWVDYGPYWVSDSLVRSKLQEIANYFCNTLYLTSGDRWGSGSSLVMRYY